jgi:Tfp pilus assembly protein PilZ
MNPAKTEKIHKIRKYNIVIYKLFNLILNMNTAQQVRLLEKAEKLFKERRACIRKPCEIPVRYATADCIYSNDIINISQNGAFIKTQKPLFVGEEILMNFELKGFNEPLKIIGEVIHADRSGIGVQFKDVSHHLAEMIGVVVNRIKE